MRIVDRQTFLGMPSGTLYYKFHGAHFEPLCIKGRSLDNDWIYLPLDQVEVRYDEDYIQGLMRAADENSLKLDIEGYCRDGCFDADQKFAVLDAAEVSLLIQRLQLAFQEGYQS